MRMRGRRYTVYEQWETWRTRERGLHEDGREKIHGACTVGNKEDKIESEGWMRGERWIKRRR